MVSLDNHKIKDLQDLFKQMGADPDSAQDKVNFPLAIPDDADARQELIDQLRFLFVEGIKRASGSDEPRHYPIPQTPNGGETVH